MRSLEWLAMVRHGESIGNVAANEAADGGLDEVALAVRDADVPLSDAGRLAADG